MTKGFLDNKNIEYEYKLLSSLNEEDQQKYINMAKQAQKMTMPLIIKNDRIISLQEA